MRGTTLLRSVAEPFQRHCATDTSSAGPWNECYLRYQCSPHNQCCHEYVFLSHREEHRGIRLVLLSRVHYCLVTWDQLADLEFKKSDALVGRV
jgi:coproporphyrinogen III oxidase